MFYFPGTEKVDNDFLGSAEYQPEEVRFILDLNSSEEYKSDLTPEDGSVIFPFWKGDGYPPLLKPLYRIKVPLFPDLPSWLTPYVNIAQVIQVTNIKNDGYLWLFPIKADEITNKIVNELLDQSEDSGSLEIDFVAHSGGAHIALNTTPFMPAEFKVDDLVTMGGLFKAYEWKETGRLDSVGHFYDILSDRDTTVLPVRNGLILGFNYTAWHRGSCDWGCIWRQFGMGWSGQTAQCCTPGLGDLPNTERIRAGTSHSSYWSNAGVNAHLQQILCENKR